MAEMKVHGSVRVRVGRTATVGWVAAASALVGSGCVTTVTDDPYEEPVAAENAALKNGTTFNGSGMSRGAVGIYFWAPLWNEWHTCSGQIVSKRTIMTAAHCVEGATAASNPGTAQIIVWRPSSTSSHVPVLTQTTVTGHFNPRYTETNYATPFDIGVFVSPVDLQNVTSSDAGALAKSAPSNVTMYAFGFGYYNDGPLFYDDVGRSGAITPTYATKGAEYFFSATSSQPQICKQDSGGPLKSTTSGPLLVYGVASRHSGSGTYCRPVGHWAAVTNSVSWLKTKITGSCLETSTLYSCW